MKSATIKLHKSKQICCLCKEEFEGYGNNAQPLKKGLCCDKCNVDVIIERMKKEKCLKKN